MFSAVLHKSRFLELRRLLKDKGSEIYRLAGEINALLLARKRWHRIPAAGAERPDELLPAAPPVRPWKGDWPCPGSRPARRVPGVRISFEAGSLFQRVAEFFDKTYYVIYTQASIGTHLSNFSVSTLLGPTADSLRTDAFRDPLLRDADSHALFRPDAGLMEEADQITLLPLSLLKTWSMATTASVSTYASHRTATRRPWSGSSEP